MAKNCDFCLLITLVSCPMLTVIFLKNINYIVPSLSQQPAALNFKLNIRNSSKCCNLKERKGRCKEPHCHSNASWYYMYKKQKINHCVMSSISQIHNSSTVHQNYECCAFCDSGRNHAFIPLPVCHRSAIVIGSSTLAGLFPPAVCESLLWLSLSLWTPYHVILWRWSVAIKKKTKRKHCDHLSLKTLFITFYWLDTCKKKRVTYNDLWQQKKTQNTEILGFRRTSAIWKLGLETTLRIEIYVPLPFPTLHCCSSGLGSLSEHRRVLDEVIPLHRLILSKSKQTYCKKTVFHWKAQ